MSRPGICSRARLNLPLGVAMGGELRAVPVYGSGGFNTVQPPEKAAEVAAEQAARGLTAVKPRVKGARSDADVIAAVRNAIPSHVQVMADANEKCDLHPGAVADVAGARSGPAVRRGAAAGACARRLSRAHRIRAQQSQPASICRRARASCRSSRERIASVIQPDLAMVGGLTPVLELATLAEAFDAIVSPHFLPGLFAHVAAACPSVRWLEEFPLLEPLFDGWPAIDCRRRHHDGVLFAGARAQL